MILNSQFSNFLFLFPKNFFYEKIRKKYNVFLNKLPLPFDDITDFINWSIQSVSFPAIAAETSEQIINSRFGKKLFRSSKTIDYYLPRELNIIFKTTEGFLNYFIMQEQLFMYFSYEEKEKDKSVFLPDLTLHLFDFEGNLLVSQIYKDIIFYGISDLELSYSSNVPEFKTFTANFKYNQIEIKQEF